MKLTSLTIRGFRCYGDQPTTVRFSDLTAFVGSNGSGKTAVLVALQRMFGSTKQQRSLTREDFHLPPGAQDPIELHMEIEARFSFPELVVPGNGADPQASSGGKSGELRAVPDCLRHILASAQETGASAPPRGDQRSSTEADAPLCRIRLSATWRKSASIEGDIDERLEWINSMIDAPPTGAVHALHNFERSMIQVLYVPASRDAARELRFASGTLLARVLNGIEWSDSTRSSVAALANGLSDQLRVETGFTSFEGHLQEAWKLLHGEKLGTPALSLTETDLQTVLRRLDAHLIGEKGALPVALLSEGERSLLYFALVIASLRHEAEASDSPGASSVTPVLTLLAVEEPENHLSPFYLSRILKNLRGVARAQVALTSHSAAILRRVRPEEVRHLRVAADGSRVVSEITLPSDSEESLKYVREAVQAHPELYFASVVVLGEGASEEVVLPRVARALDVDVDPRFIAVVPLGGRHVNHMWRLLRGLGTPHVTLVDLDMERHEGGWKRLDGLAQNLLAAGESRDDVRGPLPDAVFGALREKGPAGQDDPMLATYLAHLESRFNLFLSAPLDLDMMFLSAFEETYRALPPKGYGPRVPSDEPKRSAYLAKATDVVLGGPDDEGEEETGAARPPSGTTGTTRGVTYDQALRSLFPLYRYLFLSGSKPVAHARALATLEDADLASKCPSMLRRLVLKARDLAEKCDA